MVTVDANAVFFAVKESQNHQLQDWFYTHRKCVRKAGINIKSWSCQRFLKTNYLDTFFARVTCSAVVLGLEVYQEYAVAVFGSVLIAICVDSHWSVLAGIVTFPWRLG